MRIVDKMILFNRFLNENEQKRLEIDDHQLQNVTDHYKNQSRYWKNKEKYNELLETISLIRDLKDKQNKIIDEINFNVEELLRKEEVVMMQRDYHKFDTNELSIDLASERQDYIDKDFLNFIQSRIGLHSEWKYAGLELNPGNGKLTYTLIASDPLYLYSGNFSNISDVKKKFNNFFAEKRLMIYNSLDDLPKNSIRIASSVNSYEFLPLDPIKEEMKKVYRLLIPGGNFIFTYNDCEQQASLDLCTNDYRAYNTKTLMQSLVYSLGFDIVKSGCFKGTYSWMDVRKPGNLVTQKLSAPLVTIDD